MKYSFYAKTDPGRARENNEDSVVFDDATHVAVLADGMGGYNAGEIASGMATAFIKSELHRWLLEVSADASDRDVRRAVELCVENANRSIFNAANSNNQYTGMGTTLVVGVFRGRKLLLGHIGDSRCYRLRAGILTQITKDHSLLQEQIDAGLLTAAQAVNSPIKNLVTRALGVDEVVLLEIHEHVVETGDLYVMCSDGLSDMVDDEAIAKIISTDRDLQQMSDALVNAANDGGGRDNISVLMVGVTESAEKRGLIARWLGK
ncbi:Stp1/IreP family PP2C-type Ser/Thr phosphatase [Rhodoferax aquaticus]|uniref:Stp1/IreP family PP2C-type Ser/Thr phosphatase n=1 Tax=Rhodoferax aquaticus TaxID=2527691 RepID=A0A515EJQ0_9BURK|nr:Stp1/IreP family PP2C-type Ser/Thr phosphatase [Rhodoferax aquaticus]QDL52876.1 Stp1/IreP family PP2C-type Ser/Thr phosphatase [Rhodoferax aquaticus]